MLNTTWILLAQTLPEFDELSQGKTYTYLSEFVNMLISLGVVLTLLMATVWVLKKIMHSRLTHLNNTSAIRVLEKRVLGQKSALYLVEVMGKGALISESSAGIQMISIIEGKEWEAELAALDAPPEPQEMRRSFSLKQWIKRYAG